MFEPHSRYFAIATATLTRDGRTFTYVGRRFLSPAETLQEIGQVTVIQGDRLDLIAARELGEPEIFWRICDANNAMDPEELTEKPGTKLRIALGGLLDSGGGLP
jgi:hypothetical protein